MTGDIEAPLGSEGGQGLEGIPGLASSDLVQLESCVQLSRHLRIQARRDGVLHFVGRVDDIMPAFSLFWALSDLGERRIISFDEYEVYQLRSRLDVEYGGSSEAPRGEEGV